MNSGGETMKQIIHEMQDMTYLSWAKTRNSSGIAGSFLKAYEEGTEEKTYYKLSNYDAWKGITGHECVNEIIVDRLLTVLGIEHLSYQLIHALVQIDQKRCETWLCASRNFKRRGESKIALDGCPADKRSAILSQQKSAYATQHQCCRHSFISLSFVFYGWQISNDELFFGCCFRNDSVKYGWQI